MKKLKNIILIIKNLKNFHLILLDHLGVLKNRIYQIKFRNGLKLFLRSNTNDRSIIREILMKRQYLRHDNDFGRQGIIIFDIGANIGSFSLLAAHANPESTIYAFEPETVNFEIFLKSISANNIKNINAYNFAVGNTGGKMKLSLSPNTGGHTLVNDHEFIKRNRISEKYETVDVTSLREFVLENKILIIDFLKMDIEGGEYDIFFHLDDEIFNRISTISMEYHFVDEQKNGDKLKELFEKKGFSVSMNYPMLYATRK